MKHRLISFAGVLFFLLLAAGCGSTSQDDSDAADNADASSATVTLSGTLATGSLSALSIKADAVASDYTVVAIDKDTQEIYTATTDAAGTFSLDVPSDASYMISMVYDGSYAGPVVFDQSDLEVHEAILPTQNTDLGAIVLDDSSGYAMTETVPGELDSSVVAMADAGVPVGAGSDGKITQEGVTLNDSSDEDADGIPNIFDADEDNDGIRNGISSSPSGASVISDHIQTVYMSSNIWADHDTTEGAQDLIAMRLHVEPKSGHEDEIADVQCVGVPASIADVATVRWASSLGDPEGYPDENSVWQDSGNHLYRTTTLTPEEWIVSLKPGAVMNVGDTFTIRVTYTDETTEDFFVTMSYVLTDWARIATYNDLDLDTSHGTKTEPVAFSSDTLAITISKAKDEDGNVLEGLQYSVRYAPSTFDADASQFLVPSEDVTEEDATDNGDGTLSFTIPTETAQTYYVAPVAGTTDGQRNGEEVWFTRQ